MKNILIILCVFSLLSCKNETTSNKKASESQEESIETIKEQSVAEIKAKLVDEGYEVFDYVDEKTKDTTLMQQYFIAFLKRGPIRNQNEEESARLQKEHLAHLGKMYELGYADISGPFGDDGDIRGITIYNVPTLEMADSLANADPMVKAGRLVIELHPWWAAKGFPLR
ncbi:YciI family protein [Winogradskyella sp.]|uniref:YciI family protein n=1 Tax=Winogradskyella sp. TaxID=1883156 RepID=UPI001B1814BE|nr:YciI family protein [Winogradskyella sp.]MBO6879408.1 hypothetical protein [Winogradskyella sp.]